MIQTLSWLIPLAAVAVLLVTAPGMRRSIQNYLERSREYFYGDQPEQGTTTEEVATVAEAPTEQPATRSELLSFDHSIYERED